MRDLETTSMMLFQFRVPGLQLNRDVSEEGGSLVGMQETPLARSLVCHYITGGERQENAGL